MPAGNRIGAAERNGPDGELEALTAEEVARVADEVAGAEAESVAVCLLHADRHPAHEKKIGDVLGERFGKNLHVSLSHDAGVATAVVVAEG